MRVTIVSCVFPPEPVVSSITSSHLALELARLGHDVTVITAFPSRPAGRLYPSYQRNLFQNEQHESGYRIVRCFATTSPQSTMASRFLENLSFGVTSACAALFSRRADVIYANTWPIFAQAFVLIVAFLRGSRLVLSLQDVYPESLLSQQRIRKLGFVARTLRWVDTMIARRSDALVVISDCFAQIYKQDRGVVPDRVHVIPNWMEEQSIRASSDPAAFRAGKGIPADAFLVVYSGNVGFASGIDTVVEAWRHLAGEQSYWLLVAGEGGLLATCRGLAADVGTVRIVFHSPYPVEDTSNVLASADLLVLPTRGQQSLYSVPSKIVSYMLAGKPILCQALPESDLAKTVKTADCGWVVEPDRLELLAEAIEQIRTSSAAERQRRGRAGEQFALQNFSKSALLPRIINIIESSVTNTALTASASLPGAHE
jgi:glycosyltransferase involved in cell wall biosynthesis